MKGDVTHLTDLVIENGDPNRYNKENSTKKLKVEFNY